MFGFLRAASLTISRSGGGTIGSSAELMKTVGTCDHYHRDQDMLIDFLTKCWLADEHCQDEDDDYGFDDLDDYGHYDHGHYDQDD